MLRRVASLVVLLLAVATSCSAGPDDRDQDRLTRTQAPTGGSAPTASFTAPPPVTCPTATVTVTTADELTAALTAAQPGDVITLADGTYAGRFTATARGSEQQPVFLCGSAAAVLDGGGVRGGYVLHLDGAAYWRVVGLTVRNGQKGVVADGVTHTVLQGLTVEQIGDEGIHLRRASTDNIVRDAKVHDTGKRRDKFGEGVYVGTATSNWCTVSDCQPDRSDRNLVLDNTITATTAESVDVKEGTTGGVVAGNTFDGAALSGADSWVDVKGNQWLVLSNTGTTSPVDGFQTHEIEDGWGADNTFAGNVGTELAQDSDEGVLVGLHPDRGSVVACDNAVPDSSAALTNADTCTG